MLLSTHKKSVLTLSRGPSGAASFLRMLQEPSKPLVVFIQSTHQHPTLYRSGILSPN